MSGGSTTTIVMAMAEATTMVVAVIIMVAMATVMVTIIHPTPWRRSHRQGWARLGAGAAERGEQELAS